MSALWPPFLPASCLPSSSARSKPWQHDHSPTTATRTRHTLIGTLTATLACCISMLACVFCRKMVEEGMGDALDEEKERRQQLAGVRREARAAVARERDQQVALMIARLVAALRGAAHSRSARVRMCFLHCQSHAIPAYAPPPCYLPSAPPAAA